MKRIFISEHAKRAIVNNPAVQAVSFPHVITASASQASAALPEILRWVGLEKQRIEEALTSVGTVLFRGFPLATAEDFDAFVTAFGYPAFTYAESLSNAVRINRTPRVFTANESPPSFPIHLHHEMAQTPLYPAKLFFFCEKPADVGGATSLCRSDLLYEALIKTVPEFVQRCEQEGLRYTHVMPDQDDATSGLGRSWRSTFGATVRAQAESRMQKLGYSWEWLPDGALRVTTPVVQGVRTVDAAGRKTFFNQLIAACSGWKDARNDPSRAVVHGQGGPLDFHAVKQVISIANEMAVDLAWQAGDVALIDNYLVMHGRRTFEGKRSVLAALAAE